VRVVLVIQTVAASLVRDHNIPVFAIKGEDNDTYYSHILAAIDHSPTSRWTTAPISSPCCTPKRQDALEGVIGGTEETTTGVIRLAPWRKKALLRFPIVAVNDADTSICSTTVTAPDIHN